MATRSPTSVLPDPAARLKATRAAIAYLKTKGLLVTVVDRDAEIRTYTITGSSFRYLPGDVLNRARREGWTG